MRNMTKAQRRAIIRSSMFLKDKYFASSAFEKFKARLVAGGDQQDRTMYEDLSAPTAATANVFAMAALAAQENRVVATVDIGGAYLNASVVESGVIVHMRLDKVMTEILVKIDPEFKEFVAEDGSSVVDLFFAYLRTQFPVITVHKRKTLSYLGMFFDSREEGAVFVTMQVALGEILEGCGVNKCSATPAGDNLFVIRDAESFGEGGSMVSLIRGQDPVHRQTGEARVVPYGGKFPDVQSRSLRHRRSRKSQTIIGIHTQNTYRRCVFPHRIRSHYPRVR